MFFVNFKKLAEDKCDVQIKVVIFKNWQNNFEHLIHTRHRSRKFFDYNKKRNKTKVKNQFLKITFN